MFWVFAALIACAIGGTPAPARAEGLNLADHIDAFWTTVTLQDRASGRDRSFGRGGATDAIVARFASQGGPGFILDQSNARPLLRFDGSSEIWVLRASAGLRGDIFYRNDVGEVMLRATRLGGLTLYTLDDPRGLPCAVRGGAGRLEMTRHDVRTLFRHMLREAARGGQAIRGQLEVRADNVEPDTDDIYGDAVSIAIDGIVRTGQTEAGRERLSGLRVLAVVEGALPGARRTGDTLTITISPSQGLAGRPSSARVARALV